jgi:hypothetical protein
MKVSSKGNFKVVSERQSFIFEFLDYEISQLESNPLERSNLAIFSLRTLLKEERIQQGLSEAEATSLRIRLAELGRQDLLQTER